MNRDDNDDGQNGSGDGAPSDNQAPIDNKMGDDAKEPGQAGEGTTIYGDDDDRVAKDNTPKAKDIEREWKKNIKDAGRGSGDMPSSFSKWLKKMMKPKVNWRKEIQKFVNGVFAEQRYGGFNKRFVRNGLYIPAPKKIDKKGFKHAVIAIDTSGSIDQRTLNKFGNELLSLFNKYKVEYCYVIWCDADIPKKGGVQVFKTIDKSFKLDNLNPTGGGGTSFIPPFEWVNKWLIKKRKITPAFFIYFTDAYGEAPKKSEHNIKKYVKRVLWIVTDNLDARDALTFGKIIYLDKVVD